ncbi:amidohydrolase family protein [Planosporangium thailandense]|uniref:Amidohydrolase family protein n=1 Tax=Planosporangium thailandense TaxID=765197 RepID=A0ABX0Y230_9ACTN|nr:amidohydrolase family protein [Planosporangium thailandense]NJC72146.1 amidohydrolase family protein [Planosporangium thailandense]
MTPATLYRNGRIYSASVPASTALLVTDEGRVGWLGADDAAPAADRVVDVGGALIAPAFVDAHVHTLDTGITLLGLDLAGTRSREDVLDSVARYVADLPGDAVVVGHGWDESGWADQRPPTAAELDRAAGGRAVYLSQASVHSALVSSPLLARVSPDEPGYAADGWLRRSAHHVVRAVAHGSVTAAQRRRAQEAALRHAASLGIAAVHECGGPGTSDEEGFQALLATAREGGLPEVYGYWGELGAAAKARELGAVGAGGDLYADGALGSHTAHLREPYLDADTSGHGYVTAEQVADHLVGCVRAGVQGGFHAIGDAAIATVLDGFAQAAAVVGLDALRAGRHRIEHLEILDRELIRGLVEYGVTASMQPAFDRLWGGEHGMYAQRLGVARSLAANPLGALAGVGVALAFGSDSPVTPLDPWGTIRAAMCHHNPVYRVSARTAFAAHTRGGWRAVGRDDDGRLAPGTAATFAVWDVTGSLDGGLPALREDDPLPMCRRTVLRGEVIYDVEDA